MCARVPRRRLQRHHSEGLPAPGVKFHSPDSIESIHLIDNTLAPEFHLSGELGAVRYMEADVTSRKIQSLNLNRQPRTEFKHPTDPSFSGIQLSARPARAGLPSPATQCHIRSSSAPSTPRSSTRGSAWHSPAMSTLSASQGSHRQLPADLSALSSTCSSSNLAEMLHSPRSNSASPLASPQCQARSSSLHSTPDSTAHACCGADQAKVPSQWLALERPNFRS